MRLGILGFGEAGLRFAQDLSQGGLTDIVAYSRTGAKEPADGPLHAQAAAAGAKLVKTLRALCKGTDVVIALTPGKSAVAAARKTVKYLSPGQIYVDMSSAAVKTMEDIAQLLDGKARFIDAAIMSPVPLNGIKAGVAASGADAEAFRALMEPYGMTVTVVGSKPGGASAMKLLRSVCMKGLSGVLIESLEAAQRYGVLDAVAADIAGSFEERSFAEYMKRYVCGTVVHAARREHEMADALALLNALGSSTRMTKATRSNLADLAKMGLREKFNAREPATIAAAIEAIVELRPKA